MKRILAIILILIMTSSLFVSCNKNGEETQSSTSHTNQGAGGADVAVGDKVDKLVGKTPKEMYDATLRALKAMSEYHIVFKNINRVNFGGEPLVSESSEEYRVNGSNTYIKYVSSSEEIEEIWFVDGTTYQSTPEGKVKSNSGTQPVVSMDNIMFPLKDTYFTDAKFVKLEDGYKLEISINKEDYAEYSWGELADAPLYVLTYDDKGNILSAALSVIYGASDGVTIEEITETEFKECGASSEISAPADADTYRYAPSIDEIDLSAVDSLDKVTDSSQPTDYVMIDVKDYGKMVIRLFPNVAPDTVANFKDLVSQGFYDGLIFHRVIKDFMIQGGDIDGDGFPNEGVTTIKGEFYSNGFINNLSHWRGVISMARLGDDMDSASTQFFIMHKDRVGIDGEYAAFGYVVYGLDVVDSIAGAATDEDTDKPITDVVINSAKFVALK